MDSCFKYGGRTVKKGSVKRAAEEHGAKPEPGSAVIVELDERWHFLQKKTTRAGYGRRMIVIRRLRRSCIISKSKEMLNAAIALFAAIHVNETWTPETSLFS